MLGASTIVHQLPLPRCNPYCLSQHVEYPSNNTFAVLMTCVHVAILGAASTQKEILVAAMWLMFPQVQPCKCTEHSILLPQTSRVQMQELLWSQQFDKLKLIQKQPDVHNPAYFQHQHTSVAYLPAFVFWPNSNNMKSIGLQRFMSLNCLIVMQLCCKTK